MLSGGDQTDDERRTPGSRGQATRQRLLDQTLALLDRNGFRELRVADIAREAGTSPATFYQYFGDSEDAILALLDRLVADVDSELLGCAETYRESPDPAALEAFTHQLADGFLSVWSTHRSLIRVIELQDGEAGARLKDVRRTLLNGVTGSLEAIIESFGSNQASARSRSFVLIAMLANVAAHQQGMISAGVGREALTDALSDQLILAMTGSLVR